MRDTFKQNLSANIAFDENKADYRAARDYDMRLGLVGGTLLGLGAGGLLSEMNMTGEEPLSKMLARRILFGGTGAAVGAIAGSKLAAHLYDSGTTDKVLDKLIEKLAIRRAASMLDFSKYSKKLEK